MKFIDSQCKDCGVMFKVFESTKKGGEGNYCSTCNKELYLTPEELYFTTGYVHKTKQIKVLREQRIAFSTNRWDEPRVLREALKNAGAFTRHEKSRRIEPNRAAFNPV